MDAEHRPRISLAELMILVAATALGFALLRTTIESSGGGYLRHVPLPYSHAPRRLGFWPSFYYFFALVNGVPQILVACAGIIVLSLRRRRSLPIPLSHRPGFVLCLAAVASSILTTVVRGAALWMQADFLALWRLIVFGILPNAGFMVLGAWMVLALAGRGGPIRSFLDRIGYGLGLSLVVLLALESGRMLLESARVM